MAHRTRVKERRRKADTTRRAACFAVAAAVLGGSGTTACTKGARRGDEPANEHINAEARKRADAIHGAMSRGENTSVPCAGATAYATALASDKSSQSAALAAEIRSLCEHDAPIAFARAALAKLPARSAVECATIGNALDGIPTERRTSREAKEVFAKHAALCTAAK